MHFLEWVELQRMDAQFPLLIVLIPQFWDSTLEAAEEAEGEPMHLGSSLSSSEVLERSGSE